METHDADPRSPRAIGVACAGASTGLGLLYLAAAGAPAIYLAVNALALVLGLTVFALTRYSRRAPRLPGAIAVALGGLLLATALSGTSVEGASRWIRVGGLSLQVSLIVLPAMLVAFARGRDLLSTIGVALAAVALALQPDRAMAGVLLLSLAVLVLYRQDRWVVSTLVVAAAGFAVTLARPDSLPAVPYVDQVLRTAFRVHAAAGLAVVSGALLLVVPAVAGWRIDPGNRDVYAVFGALWLGVVAAAALGNYPTPVVGYGGSAILGYALSLSLIPGEARSAAAVRGRAREPGRGEGDVAPDLRIGVASGRRSGERLRRSLA